jgi:hypothetical protein
MANYVLEILDGDRVGDVLPVSARPLRIGRKPGNDLVIADEKTSGVHAEVVLEGDRHVLRDLGSTNGTFLDGKRVTEIVLSTGDIVTIGRVRVKFRGEGEPAATAAGAGGDPALQVHTLDAARLGRRGSSAGVLALLVLVAAGGGGWFWWQSRASGGDEVAAPQRRAPLQVAGNRLAAAAAGCEAAEGWKLAAAGAGFQPATRAHSGSGAFEAVRGDGAEVPDFALATLAEPVPVFAGRSILLAAHLRADGGAQVAVRAVFSAANEAVPFRFRTGAPLAAHAAWERVEVQLAVPPGCDRMQVEIVAVLPSGTASAGVDDVAITEAGSAVPIESQLKESSQTALGCGAAFAVRSTDVDNPATVLAVEPDVVPAVCDGLHKAGLCCLSDLGATLACTAGDRSFQLDVKGIERLAYVLPAEAASGLLVGLQEGGAEGDRFGSAAAESEFTTRSVLLGDRTTRLMLQFAAPVACRGKLGSGTYRLSVGAAGAELVLGFLAKRGEASTLLREARQQADTNAPGAALALLERLATERPHDAEILAQAGALRAQVLAGQAEAVRRLSLDLEEARFFDTRGGFERVAAGVDDLIARYGNERLEDAATVTALQQAARERLLAMGALQQEAQRNRLVDMAKALRQAQQEALAGAVDDYVKRHLGGGN